MTVREAREIKRVKILGCGSACYAGDLGAQLIEDLARVPATAEAASEFRYRNPVVEPDTLYVAVSQSGETIDTLAAVQELQRKGGRVIGIINVVGSTIARQVDGGIYLHAGPEMSVAATKSFTSTVTAFALLALHLGRIRDLSPTEGRRIIAGLNALPDQITEILAQDDEIAGVAKEIAQSSSVLFVGRRRGWPVAREGAQKLKEISYVHAEAYPSAELKHGPLALVSPEHADRRDRPRRRPAGQEHLDAVGDQGARGSGDRRGAPGAAGRAGRPDRGDPEGASPSWTRSCCRCRCRSWPTTPRWPSAATWTSRATWPRASRSSSRPAVTRVVTPSPGLPPV